MALQNEQDQLIAAWRALGVQNGQGWRMIDLLHKNNCIAHAGRKSPGNEEALLVGIKGSQVGNDVLLPKGQGFSVLRIDNIDVTPGRTWFALIRNSEGQLGFFTLMTADLAILLKKVGNEAPSQIYNALMTRIRAWQEFMKRDSMGQLSAEEEIGLIGELLVFKDMLESGISPLDVIDSWTGPDDGVHDYLIGTGAVEVKTTVSPVGFVAKISNLEQLDDSLRHPLYLAGVRLSQAISGQTLPEFYSELLEIIHKAEISTTLFESKLISAGYVNSTRDQYIRRFKKVHISYKLINDSTPRLVRSNVPAAVQFAKYSLDLECVPEVATMFIELIENLGAKVKWN